MIAFSNSLRKTSRRTRTERSASWKTRAGALVCSAAPLEHFVQLLQVADLAHEVGFFRPVGGGADDQPARPFVGAVDHLAQPVALFVGEPAADADARARRREDQVAAGDRDVHREPRALRLQRVLDHLDEDLLAGLDQLVDAAAGAAAALRRLLAVREDDLVDVEEAVALEADVDEGGLHAGKDVVDLPLVDVADDRAPAAALDVELGDVALCRLSVFDSRTATRVSPRSAETKIVFFICDSAQFGLGTHAGALLRGITRRTCPFWLSRAWMLML